MSGGGAKEPPGRKFLELGSLRSHFNSVENPEDPNR